MNKSETITKLAEALSKFQSQVEGAKKDSNNPFYKSKYADLAQIWKTVREPLTQNGLSVSQVGLPSEPEYVNVETILLHSSGEWISGITTLKLVKNDPQGAGSAITYARRYGLSAILGIHQEDDDANSHIKSEQPKQQSLANDKKRLSAMLKTKVIAQDMAEHYSELISVSTMPEEIANIESKLMALPDKPDAVQLKKECAAILQKLIDAKIDGFDTETRRHNSFQKHLATDKLNDCTDAEKLTAYKAYLEDKLNSKPTIKQRQDALIDKLTAMPIMIEELQHWTEITQSATRHAALDEVQAWIDKVEAK